MDHVSNQPVRRERNKFPECLWSWIYPLFHAIAFLTRIPVPVLTDSKEDWQKSVAYYPVVGLMMGLILWGSSALLSWLFPQPLSAVVTLVVWVYITGGLHLDGWMDLADGLGSNRPQAKILEIMKDSRVGAMGVTAAILLVMLKTTALYNLQLLHLQKWLLLAPLAARWDLLFAIWLFPYISEKGLGTGLRAGLNRIRLALASVFVIGVTWVLTGYQGLIAVGLTLVCGWLFARYIAKRLDGLTGDCYGAIVEGTELCALLFLVLIGKWL